jgi:hypothetical protein
MGGLLVQELKCLLYSIVLVLIIFIILFTLTVIPVVVDLSVEFAMKHPGKLIDVTVCPTSSGISITCIAVDPPPGVPAPLHPIQISIKCS